MYSRLRVTYERFQERNDFIMDRSRNSEQSNNRGSAHSPDLHRLWASQQDRGTANQRTDQEKGKESIRDAPTGTNPTVRGSGQEENDKPREPKSVLKKPTESPKPKADPSKHIRFANPETNTFQIASQQEERLGKRKRQQNDQFPQITKKSNKLQETRKEINSRQKLHKAFQEQTEVLNQDIRDVIDILSKRFESFQVNPLETNSSKSIYKHNEIIDSNKQLSSQHKNISNQVLIEYLKDNKDKALNKQEPNYVYHNMINILVDRHDKLSKNIKFNEQKLQKLAKDEQDLLIEYNDTRHFGQSDNRQSEDLFDIVRPYYEQLEQRTDQGKGKELVRNVSTGKPTGEAGKSILEIIEPSDRDDETHPTLKEGMKRGESSQQKELLGKQKMQQDDQFPQITETQIREIENQRQELEAYQLDQKFHQNFRQVLQIREVELNLEIRQRIPKEFSSIFDYFKENPHKINDLENIPEYKDLFDRQKQLSKQREGTSNMIKFAKENRLQVDQTVINYLENELAQIQKAINENVKKIDYYRIINKLANKQYVLQKEIDDNKQKLKETNEESNLTREYAPYFDILRSDIGNNERT
jgi:hypothetical protein